MSMHACTVYMHGWQACYTVTVEKSMCAVWAVSKCRGWVADNVNVLVLSPPCREALVLA